MVIPGIAIRVVAVTHIIASGNLLEKYLAANLEYTRLIPDTISAGVGIHPDIVGSDAHVVIEIAV